MADPVLLLQPRHLEELRHLIATFLPQEEVWVYGSRLAGTAHETSDLDLVVRHPGDLKAKQSSAFWELKEAISESDLPFLVKLFDWAILPAAFWENIVREHVVLYSPALRAQFVEESELDSVRVNDREPRDETGG
jgi:predicted nucleotidyltransferase